MNHLSTTIGTLAFIFAAQTMAAPAVKLTREDLLKGSKVPEHREFPLTSKVGACEDFHKYVCDGVESSFKLPKDRSNWTFAFSDSAERLLQAKKNFFKALKKGYEPKLERSKNVRRLFVACMNVKARTQGEKVLVQNQIREISSIKTADQLKEFISKRSISPFFSFIEIDDIPNQDNPLRNDVFLAVDGMTLPEKTYYDKPENVEDVRRLAVALFTDLKMDKVQDRAKAVVEFERALAKTYPLPAEFRQIISSNTYMSREDFIKKYPHVPFDATFAAMADDTKVRNVTKDSLALLDGYFKDTPIMNIQSVLIYHTLKGYMDDAYPKYFKTYFAFQKKHLGGPEVRPDREERCTKTTMRSLGMELDAELIPILFPDFPAQKVVDLAQEVRGSILKGIEKNEWLSKDARKEADSKMRNATLKLVKPETEKDWNFLDVADLDEKKPIENAIAIAQARINKFLKELKEDRVRTRWSSGPLTVNAYYSPMDNQFVLLQGILQYPFFDAGMNRIENIGAMGTVVGHELGHGIDDEGSKYDTAGKLRQWMTMKDLKEFTDRGQKFVDRFNKAGFDGRLTLGENIGDHVGLTFARDTAFGDKEPSLEDARKFYMAYARVWCAVNRPEYEQLLIKTDPHALGRARINEQVIHHDLFHKAFACKAGDKMWVDPKDRIRVW